MTTYESLTAIGALIVIIGWFVNSRQNRKNEIAKERLKLRIELLMPVLDVFIEVQKHVVKNGLTLQSPEIVDNLFGALAKLTFLGKSDEKELCDSLFQKLIHNEPIGAELTKLTIVVSNRVKDELKMQ